MNGESPTKLDSEVLSAMNNMEIDPEKNPCITKCRNIIMAYPSSQWLSWPRPTRRKSLTGTPNCSPSRLSFCSPGPHSPAQSCYTQTILCRPPLSCSELLHPDHPLQDPLPLPKLTQGNHKKTGCHVPGSESGVAHTKGKVGQHPAPPQQVPSLTTDFITQAVLIFPLCWFPFVQLFQLFYARHCST